MYTKNLRFKIIEDNQWSRYPDTYENRKKKTFEERLQEMYDLLHQKGAKIIEIKFLTAPDHRWSLNDEYGNGFTTVEYSAIIYYIPDLEKEKEYEMQLTRKARALEEERLTLEEDQTKKEEANKPINWEIPIK